MWKLIRPEIDELLCFEPMKIKDRPSLDHVYEGKVNQREFIIPMIYSLLILEEKG